MGRSAEFGDPITGMTAALLCEPLGAIACIIAGATITSGRDEQA